MLHLVANPSISNILFTWHSSILKCTSIWQRRQTDKLISRYFYWSCCNSVHWHWHFIKIKLNRVSKRKIQFPISATLDTNFNLNPIKQRAKCFSERFWDLRKVWRKSKQWSFFRKKKQLNIHISETSWDLTNLLQKDSISTSLYCKSLLLEYDWYKSL